MFKWIAAAFIVFCCFIPAIIVVLAAIAALVGGTVSNLHHP
jgi:hypothetical protein